jgi:hypothetical protein
MTTPQPLLARVRETLREFIDYGYSREKAVALLAELDASAMNDKGGDCHVSGPESIAGNNATPGAAHPKNADKPEGSAQADWVLVPREPTEAMLLVIDELNPPLGAPEALTNEYCAKWRRRHRVAAIERWKAMLAAAPQPPQVPQTDEAVPAWKQAIADFFCDCGMQITEDSLSLIERRARELAKEGAK